MFKELGHWTCEQYTAENLRTSQTTLMWAVTVISILCVLIKIGCTSVYSMRMKWKDVREKSFEREIKKRC